MMQTRKKLALLLLPVALVGVGAWWASGGQKRSFSNDVSTAAVSMTPSDQGNQIAVASPQAEDVSQSSTPATVANEERTNAVTEGEQGAKGKEMGKRDVTASGVSITDRLVSFGFENRSSRDIDTVVIHSSYDALGNDPYSVSGIIEEYRQYGVSAHYLIDRKGAIYRLVEDSDVAYHAGVSKTPDGRTGVNGFSIGIELVEKDTDSPTSSQYASLKSLIASLKSKYSIKFVLGHSDIAPGRKTDPWGFDWKEFK
ncbi:MAG TPA: N-acetylmuramoyl-L-alanine amidase [Candidatus Fimivivens sp.]|nr:N-acetylmuramoyl-L-alanine amidase [Candidatus Fimivivens sp.]